MPVFNDKSIQGIIDKVHAELPCLGAVADKSIRGIIDRAIAGGQAVSDISIQGIIDTLGPFSCAVPISPTDVIYESGSGVFTVPDGVTSLGIILIGGGAGGYMNYGGFPGQHLIVNNIAVTPGQNIPYTVGSGGIGHVSGSGNPAATPGGDSTFGAYTAAGGVLGSVAIGGGTGPGAGATVNTVTAPYVSAGISGSLIGQGGGGGGACLAYFAGKTGTNAEYVSNGGSGGPKYTSLSYGGAGSLFGGFDATAGYAKDATQTVIGRNGAKWGGGGGAASIPNMGVYNCGNGASGVVIIRWGV